MEPTYAQVDSDTFTETDAAPVITHSVSDIQTQITTLSDRIAQETANFQSETIAPLNAQIAAYQALLTAAQGLGMTVDPNALAVTAVDTTTTLPAPALQAENIAPAVQTPES